jgi:hypothetical protein
MLIPLLTEPDPVLSSEGALDPLGLFAIADSLSVRLVPGVRERQSHPRFLTTIAVSLSVCNEFTEDTVANDKVSEPWQVLEWYVVEGLVRTIKENELLQGLPGRDKAARAIKDQVPLSAKRYLKTPSVFGFHGVYRVLSRTIALETAGRLGEIGYDLLTTWSDEQGLSGFHGTNGGPGAGWRRMMVDAIADGLEKGAVARSTSWSGWAFFKKHLAHRNVGAKEAKILTQALTSAEGGFRGPILRFLTSEKGRKMWLETESERLFHESLIETSDEPLRDLLRSISLYESFARLLQDAFADCLFTMSRTRMKTPKAELAAEEGVKRAAARIPDLFAELVVNLAAYGETIRFQEAFASLAERLPAQEWVERLIEHHRRVQRNKPPNGKAPWFESLDDGSCIIRPGYLRQEGGRYDENYVHAYRIRPLWSFASDLGLLS